MRTVRNAAPYNGMTTGLNADRLAARGGGGGGTHEACDSAHPLQPVQMDPAKNPRYGDGVRAMVAGGPAWDVDRTTLVVRGCD
ncbi:hypothetical protein OG226_48040 [Streptomyces sp. NBC_01261]|uniref:hypothetical protein n=1 Tax=Streptomyces sp. NBC_01261 TaxID=2903802 RepID=UPI002E3397CC|nr:hypothetical protein [Streptomyces sp. NBC_01261]